MMRMRSFAFTLRRPESDRRQYFYVTQIDGLE
jgi:hypothetical protein